MTIAHPLTYKTIPVLLKSRKNQVLCSQRGCHDSQSKEEGGNGRSKGEASCSFTHHDVALGKTPAQTLHHSVPQDKGEHQVWSECGCKL